jgi:hypothetical protein
LYTAFNIKIFELRDNNFFRQLKQFRTLQVNYVKRSSFDFVTHFEFSSLALQIWKLFANPLREFAMFLSAVAIFQTSF